MSLLYFIFDLITLSFLPLLGLFVARLPKKEMPMSEVAETKEDKEVKEEALNYSWALSNEEREAAKVLEIQSQRIPLSNNDNLALTIAIFAILISPLAFGIAHFSPLSYLIAVISFIIIYIWQRDTDINNLHIKITNLFSLLPTINFKVLKNTLLDIKEFLNNQSKTRLIYTILALDAIYLDLFVAKISLDKLGSAAYILLSIFVKILIVLGIYLIHRWLIEQNIFKTKALDSRVLSIFFGSYMLFTYISFLFSKVFVKTITFGSLTSFHTALPYVLGSHLLLFLLFTLVYINNQNLNNKKDLQNFILHFLISLHGAVAIMLIFFSISSLEAVTFFISGLALFLLTLFYHLFYRLHIYSQLV